MLSHTGTLWHYLGSFVIYTLLAVGVIYGAYWYSRRATGGGSLIAGKKKEQDPTKLELESTLALEPRKTLYVVRSGNERFLIAASGEVTQLISKLDAIQVEQPEVVAPPVLEKKVDLPWYAEPPIKPSRNRGIGARFVQSVQWLVSARTR